MHQMGVEANILADIIAGRKTVEARLRTAKFVTLRKGDSISFREDVWENDRITSSTPNKATAIITETLFFDTFEDMFKAIKFTDALPHALTAQDAVATYRKFYTGQQELEYGVVALRFEITNS